MFTQASCLRCFTVSMGFSILHARVEAAPNSAFANWRGAALWRISGNFFTRERKPGTVENKIRLIRRGSSSLHSLFMHAIACSSRVFFPDFLRAFCRRHAKYKIRRGQWQETQKWFSWILQMRVNMARSLIRCAPLSKSCFGIIGWDRERDSYRFPRHAFLTRRKHFSN